MKPRIVNLEGLCKSLKPFLPQYLQEHGIDTEHNFKCLNPKHEDKTPSMTCRQVPEQAFCFACSWSCDIFTAASILDKKPDKGKDWVTENVFWLANKYNVPIPNIELTPEEIYEYKTYEAYKLAAELVADPKFGDYSVVNKELEYRKWNPELIAKWGIGTVNYQEFRDKLKQAGFDAKFQDSIGLGVPYLLDNKNLIFTVCDDEGRAVGFSARRLDYKEGDTYPKYINTAATGLECAIFKKGERLYGFDLAKDTNGKLYIFEGQANVITARHHGLMNCCCTMGTALTDHHIALLKKHGKFDIILMFDGDKAGREALENILDKKFSQERDFRIKICKLTDGIDPDELIREHGYHAFVQLTKWSAFEWRINQLVNALGTEPTEEESYEIAKKVTPLIVSEPNYIEQEKMAKQLSKVTGVDIGTILSYVRCLRDEKINEVQVRKQATIESYLYDIRKNPEDASLLLAEAQKAVDEIENTSTVTAEVGSSLRYIQSLKEVEESKTGEFEGFNLREDTFGAWQYYLNGDWKSNRLIFVGGSSQAGKSTYCAQLAYDISMIPKNNAMCIYHSIDDAKDVIIRKWICSGSDGYALTQNSVSNPNYWKKEISDLEKLRENGYRKLLNLVKEDRLVIKDVSDGITFNYIEHIVRQYRERYPERNIVLFSDNFHKYPDFPQLGEVEKTKLLSNTLKRSAVKNSITIIATAEYRKLQAGEKPGNEALASSRSLEYDADGIIHLYNDMHYKRNKSEYVHKDEKGELLPRIWVTIGKNKVSGIIRTDFFDLYPGSAKLKYVDYDKACKEWEERKEWLDQHKDQEF